VIGESPNNYQRSLIERSLAMQAQAHQLQVKARLLTQAVMQIERSKKRLKTLNAELSHEIEVRKQIEERIRHMASHDALTGLPNRALFKDRLESARNLAVRNRQKLAVLFVDLDDFKRVNDTFGHEGGDQMLQEVSRRLLLTVRMSDTVARLGGDEFIVLLNGVSSRKSTEEVVKKILAVLGEPVTLTSGEISAHVSIGVSLFPEHGDDIDKLISLADRAMYDIKESGKNSFAFHSIGHIRR